MFNTVNENSSTIEMTRSRKYQVKIKNMQNILQDFIYTCYIFPMWQTFFSVTFILKNNICHTLFSGESECNETSQFLCRSGLCISQSLECDDYDNCDDLSDESLDYHICGKYTKCKYLREHIKGIIDN